MKKITLNIDIQLAQIDELPEEDQQLVKMAIEQTEHSYSPYSHFSVGAALRLENGMTVRGCNQENAAFSVTIFATELGKITHMRRISIGDTCHCCKKRKPRTIGRTNQSMWHLPASHHRDGDSLQTPSKNFALW